MADPQPAPIRTLIVDDAPSLRRLARAFLDGHGGFLVVGEAVDGAQGVEEALRTQPDLVLLDLCMPGTDGFAALPRLRQALPEAVVVVYSGLEGEDAVERALRLGAATFVSKEVSVADLPGQLEQVFRDRRGGEGA